MKKTIKLYENTERDIKLLTGVGYITLFISGLFLAWTIYEKKYAEISNFAVVFGTLIATILVAKVATRAISHQNYIIELENIALVNDSIFLMMDFNDRIENIRKAISGELNQPIFAIKQNTIQVEDIYRNFSFK